MQTTFWRHLQNVLHTHALVIDRQRHSCHPRHSNMIYPVDYGYIEGTAASDGAGIDVWFSASGVRQLTGILCTFDPDKKDAEIKVLLGCNAEELQSIQNFYGNDMGLLYIPAPETTGKQGDQP